ncbi:hypothetical protein ACG3SL_16045 [Sphingomonas sp. CJ20]
MANLVKKAVLGAVMGAGVLTAMAPAADAQRYRHHYRDRDDTGVAIVAGVAGLALGAALANDRRYDYDRRYYRERGYYPRDGYYYRQHYRRYRGYEVCDVRRTWDPYEGRPVLVRYCR